MKKKQGHKIISALIAICLFATMIPTMVFANEGIDGYTEKDAKDEIYEPTPTPEYFGITVTDGKTADGSMLGYEGKTITITADIFGSKVFTHWTSKDGIVFDDSEASTTTFVMPKKAVAIVANFKDTPPTPTPIPHGVQVVGGTAFPTTATEGQTVMITANSIGNKYFTKWTTDDSGVKFDDDTVNRTCFTMPDKDVKVTANYEDSSGGTPTPFPYPMLIEGGKVISHDSSIGDIVDVESNEPVEGAIFKNWTSNNEKVRFFSPQGPTTKFIRPNADIIITANYVDEDGNPLKTPYRIDVVGGTTDKKTAVEGTEITVEADTPEAGEIFYKWNTKGIDLTAEQKINPTVTFEMPAKDVSLWVEYKDKPAPIVESISVESAPTKTIYTVGEKLDLAGMSVAINYNEGDSKVVAFADFSKNGITANPVNGTSLTTLHKSIDIKMDKFTAKQGITVNPPAPTITSVNVSPERSNVQKGTTAKFSAIVNGANNPSQAVTWSLTGANNETTIATDGVLSVAIDETASTLKVNATASDGKTVGTATVTVKDIPVQKYSVTLDGVKLADYEQGHKVTVNAEQKDGKIFKEWTTTDVVLTDEQRASSKMTFEMPVKNVELTSTYNNLFIVSFNSNGGSNVNPIQVVDGGKFSAPASPVKSGYTFAGWYKTDDFATAWNFAVDTVTSATTLYAKWNTYVAPPSNNNNNYPYSPTENTDKLSDVADAKAGDVLSVDVSTDATIPTSIISDLKGKDVKVELELGNGLKWTIDGKDITNGGITVDLGVRADTKEIPQAIVNSVSTGKTSKQLSLSHMGDFGFKATLSVELGTENNGQYANLFYYNPTTKKLEFQSASMINGGEADMAFTHASDYLIVIDEKTLGKPLTPPTTNQPEVSTPAPNPATGDTTPSWILGVVALMLLVSGGVLYFSTRKVRDYK